MSAGFSMSAEDLLLTELLQFQFISNDLDYILSIDTSLKVT